MIPVLNLDIEATNRCNATCDFCPRDQTPHEGTMSMEIFEQTLARTVEFHEATRALTDVEIKVNLCGLGEPLINRHAVDMVRMIRDAGFEVSLTTNGSLLTEAKSEALLDAGLQGAEINVGELFDDYERVYGLPFEKTADRVTRFAELAQGRCDVRVVIVDYRDDPDQRERVTRYWEGRGVEQFFPVKLINRGGSLMVDHMAYQSFPEMAEVEGFLDERGGRPSCSVPFLLLFVGYDGQYYLCCSDWRKETPMGSVFERSFVDVVSPKLGFARSRNPVCISCNHDPTNQIVDALRAARRDDPDAGLEAVQALARRLEIEWAGTAEFSEALVPGSTSVPVETPQRRKSIPVVAR